jgi:hypothetical protein
VTARNNFTPLPFMSSTVPHHNYEEAHQSEKARDRNTPYLRTSRRLCDVTYPSLTNAVEASMRYLHLASCMKESALSGPD